MRWDSFAWRARVGFGPLTTLAVVDRFADGGSMEGRLLGHVKLFEADDQNTSRSAAGRAALEAVYTPASLLPQRGVSWRAESESEIVASWDVPPERPELQLRIDHRGRRAGYWTSRWGDTGQKAFGYIPCVVRSELSTGSATSSCRAGSAARGGSAPRARRRSTERRSVR